MSDDPKWAAAPGVGEDIVADIARMSKLIGEVAPPPPNVRPWCCKNAIVPGARLALMTLEQVP